MVSSTLNLFFLSPPQAFPSLLARSPLPCSTPSWAPPHPFPLPLSLLPFHLLPFPLSFLSLLSPLLLSLPLTLQLC
jgi:hypothetical protein